MPVLPNARLAVTLPPDAVVEPASNKVQSSPISLDEADTERLVRGSIDRKLPMTARLCLLLPFLCLTCGINSIQAAHPSNACEWMLRTNGLGWGEGYHAYNGCCKQGVLPRSYAPGPGYNYNGYMHAGTFGGYASPYPTRPAHERIPATLPQPIQRPMQMQPMKAPDVGNYPTGPQFNIPTNSSPSAPDRSARMMPFSHP